MKQKIVIVTGGSGFVGQEVIYQLLEKNYFVINIDKKELKLNSKNYKYFKFDLAQENNLSKVFKNADYCIHLAAEVGGVEFANKFPALILRNNSAIDSNVIKATVNSKIKRFVYISSSLVYEKSKKFPLSENLTYEIAPPDLSYGIEKLFGEKLCKAYYEEYGLSFSVCRLFNVYGKTHLGNTDPHGHVIPDLIKKVRKSKGEVELWGSKSTSRNFTNVLDIADGIIAVLESEKAKNEIFNIASPKELTIEEVVKALWKIMGKKEEPLFRYKPTGNKDVKRNFADISKSKKLLKWEARVDISEGLRKLI